MSGSPNAAAQQSVSSASRDYHFAFRQVTNIPYFARLAMLLHPFPPHIPGVPGWPLSGSEARIFPISKRFSRPRPSTLPRCSRWFRLPAEPTRLKAAELPCAAACLQTGSESGGSLFLEIGRGLLVQVRIRPWSNSRLRSIDSASTRQRVHRAD
jgi:hypothetical protein